MLYMNLFNKKIKLTPKLITIDFKSDSILKLLFLLSFILIDKQFYSPGF